MTRLKDVNCFQFWHLCRWGNGCNSFQNRMRSRDPLTLGDGKPGSEPVRKISRVILRYACYKQSDRVKFFQQPIRLRKTSVASFSFFRTFHSNNSIFTTNYVNKCPSTCDSNLPPFYRDSSTVTTRPGSCCFKMGQPRPLFCSFSVFLKQRIQF